MHELTYTFFFLRTLRATSAVDLISLVTVAASVAKFHIIYAITPCQDVTIFKIARVHKNNPVDEAVVNVNIFVLFLSSQFRRNI